MTKFADLHVPGRPFVLVNAWDVASALLLARAGHPAVGTTSLGITAAAGVPDGARAGRELTLDLVRRLDGRLPVPLTVDLEDGYHDDPSEVAALAGELAGRGVSGINLEDAGREPGEHAAIIAVVKRRVPEIFVNARTEEFWSGGHHLATALDRLRAYRDAGADGLFVPGLTDPAGVEQVVALGPPVNLLWSPDLDRVALAAAGVARISTGSAPYRYAVAAGIAAAAAARDGVGPDVAAIAYAEVQEVLVGQPDLQ